MDLKPRTSDGQLAAGSLDVGAKPRSELEARSAHGVAAFDNRDRVNESEVAGVANAQRSREDRDRHPYKYAANLERAKLWRKNNPEKVAE